MGGTLAGAALTFVFELVTGARARRAARADRLRDELRAACAAFAGTANQLRRAANDRWYRRAEDPDGRDSPAAADAFHTARTEAWAAYYRVLLAGGDDELLALAARTIEAAGTIVTAADRAEEHRRRAHTTELVTGFARAAATRLCA